MTPQCLLDMDGVLVDFMGGALRRFGVPRAVFDTAPRPIPWDWIYGACGQTCESFWQQIEWHFWSELEWTEDGKEILALVEATFGPQNVCLLTNGSGTRSAPYGKTAWVHRHLPQYRDRLLIGACKHFCTGPDRVLVDDSQDNVATFRVHGGHAILVPRPWNGLHREHAVSFLRRSLVVVVPGLPFARSVFPIGA